MRKIIIIEHSPNIDEMEICEAFERLDKTRKRQNLEIEHFLPIDNNGEIKSSLKELLGLRKWTTNGEILQAINNILKLS